MLAPLSARVAGRWASILPQLGISAAYLTGKHTACPVCGQGKDRFRFDNKDGRGTWFCTHCGAGDGVKLVMLKNGWDFREARTRIEQQAGVAPIDCPKAEQSDSEKRDAMNRLWRAGKSVTSDDPVGRYLYARCGQEMFPHSLRYVASARYQGDKSSFHPAMVAMVSDVEGKPASLHRTYLTVEGRKAAVEAPRRLMPGTLPKGAAIRLAEPTDELGIAEGIETALSASALFGTPCWAAINAGNLALWVPPNGLRRVIIFGDNDPGYAGQAAAYGLARRLVSDQLSVEIRIPDCCGHDWNDVLVDTRETVGGLDLCYMGRCR